MCSWGVTLTVGPNYNLPMMAEPRAVGRLREAVAKEDGLAYSEPADWFFPTRHLLGAMVISAGKPADAEAVYRDDLSRTRTTAGLCTVLRSH
jgi:hypothetical protein